MELTKITSQLTFDRRYSLLYVGRADDGGCDLSEMEKIIDYLISHHFDFRGLISLGLALEAPKGCTRGIKKEKDNFNVSFFSFS